MARNIEIKARIENVDVLAPRVAAMANEGPIEIVQEDIFFPCSSGRLKLRIFSSTHGELIFYRRSNALGPKESFYVRAATPEPENLHQALYAAYGELGRVRKHRTLYLIGRTRVHLDRVQNLGHFLELEVVLTEDEPSDVGEREARDLMKLLEIQPSQLIDVAYIDLFGTASCGGT